MKTTEIINSDPNYRNAVNYHKENFYNPATRRIQYPVTIKISEHRLILPFGISDRLNQLNQEDRIIIVGENSSLDYISCIEIDTTREFPEIIQDVFIQNTDFLDEFLQKDQSIFDLDTMEQVKILSNWFE